MIDVKLLAPQEVAGRIAGSAKERRLAHNFSQKTLAERSGVSLGVLKKFELTGKISLESLLKLAVALDCLEEFLSLFVKAKESFSTLDALLKERPRKRGTT